VPQEVFDQIEAALTADRAAYFTEWNKNFFNLDQTLGSRISAEEVQDAWNSAVSASPAGTIACVPTWHTDFRADPAHHRHPGPGPARYRRPHPAYRGLRGAHP
jgi:non-heme chloroperoxidase